MTSVSKDLTENLIFVRERIERAATRAGRRAEEITLVAACKTRSARKIWELYEAGVRHFAENRVQERESKLAGLTGLEATWHMIGHVQKNKAARAARLFDSVDSVDSRVLAERLSRERAEFLSEKPETRNAAQGSERSATARRLRVLIEVKLDPEPAKSGVTREEAPRLAEAVMRLAHLELRGLMGIPPFHDDPEGTRPYFRILRDLHDSIRQRFGPNLLPVLSMGMSHDFEIAIEEGATEVRIGTALFGERQED